MCLDCVVKLNCELLLQAFGDILGLVPLAESVVKLNAVCMECFRTASYTKRKGSEQQVGLNDRYNIIDTMQYTKRQGSEQQVRLRRYNTNRYNTLQRKGSEQNVGLDVKSCLNAMCRQDNWETLACVQESHGVCATWTNFHDISI